ncbi:3D domain-containing protein [Oscillibacter sp.]|uniref:3D domain-containing protein n=1 Tax=Oscillibacter sp. TaxID=1945593 RepID=UPI0028970C70|nr:3D domain-containing protein [Oscillibacter sp.]
MSYKTARAILRLTLTALTVLAVVLALTTTAKSAEPAVIADTLSAPAGPAQCWEAPDIPEDFENEKIEVALLAKANKIEDCTVTWYTASVEECGKDDGITYSGLPVVEHLTCAVDPEIIPLYSDVFVEYADGSIEQLWATDTGVTGNAIDIYTPDYDYAIQCGRQSLTVWWVAQ